MSFRDEPWPTGTPTWVDLSTTDRAAAWDFYSSIFSWEIVDTGAEFGHYGMAMLAGRTAAGLGEIMPGSDAPPSWTTYLATPDAAAAAAAITANGGTVLLEPMVIGDSGTMLLGQDPTGAVFGAWQSDNHIGCAIVNEPGALVWNECLSTDPGRAREFYGAVFGHTYTPIPGAADYATIDGAGPGDTVGGIGGLAAGGPTALPSHWMTYFMVADADATAGAVTDAGGQVQVKPFDTPFGRMAELADPQGAVFSIMSAP